MQYTEQLLQKVFNFIKIVGLGGRGLSTRYLIKMYSQGQAVPKFLIKLILKPRSFTLPNASSASIKNLQKLERVFTEANGTEKWSSFATRGAKFDGNFLIILPTPSQFNHTRLSIAFETMRLLTNFGFKASTIDFKDLGYLAKSGELLGAEWIIVDSEFSREEILMILENLKKCYGRNSFKIAMVVYDLWRRRDIEIVKFALPKVEIFLHMDEVSVHQHFSSSANKFLFWPITQVATSFQEESESDRLPTLFFSGRLMSDRLYIANEVIKAIRKTRFSLDFYFSDAHSFPLQESTYRKKLKYSELSISFSQRRIDHWIIPGRSIEILLSGSLLLQQEGPEVSPLSQFLSPYEHYIPFSSLSELNTVIKLSSGHPEVVRRIAKRGRRKTQELISNLVTNSPFAK
jgi:Glycosyl transferase family 90